VEWSVVICGIYQLREVNASTTEKSGREGTGPGYPIRKSYR
jgi:hypothetical protein